VRVGADPDASSVLYRLSRAAPLELA